MLGFGPLLLSLSLGCSTPAPPDNVNVEATTAEANAQPTSASPKHQALFGALPSDMYGEAGPASAELVALGRMLYHEKRLSINDTQSCNSCHQVENYGVDNEPTSPGAKGERGGRNSPTTYNAAGHLAQFWDGREPDVEAQAKGPILNPIEMGMPSAEAVIDKLASIVGYPEAFAKAFPDADKPMTYDNLGIAIGAFERTLVTPSRFDDYMNGQLDALTKTELAGLDRFVEVGCATCHAGPYVGGQMYQKLGLVEPYPTEDKGRAEPTGQDALAGFFKVPSLRNVEKTGPYLHDGSVSDLNEMIKIMGKHQLGQELNEEHTASILSFLNSLTGPLPASATELPKLPPT